MPYRKRAPAKRRPAYRRKAAPRRRRAGPSKGMIRVQRRVPLISIQTSTTVAGAIATSNSAVLKLGTPVASIVGATNYYDVPFALEYKLTDLQASSDLIAISDKYCIKSVSNRLLSNPSSYFAGGPLPFIEIISDFDDSSAPSMSELNQKMGLKTRTFNRTGMTSMTVRPKPAMAVADGAVTSYTIPRGATYINTSYPTVPHYGLKGVFRNLFAPGAVGSNSVLQLDLTYTCILRDIQ